MKILIPILLTSALLVAFSCGDDPGILDYSGTWRGTHAPDGDDMAYGIEIIVEQDGATILGSGDIWDGEVGYDFTGSVDSSGNFTITGDRVDAPSITIIGTFTSATTATGTYSIPDIESGTFSVTKIDPGEKIIIAR